MSRINSGKFGPEKSDSGPSHAPGSRPRVNVPGVDPLVTSPSRLRGAARLRSPPARRSRASPRQARSPSGGRRRGRSRSPAGDRPSRSRTVSQTATALPRHQGERGSPRYNARCSPTTGTFRAGKLASGQLPASGSRDPPPSRFSRFPATCKQAGSGYLGSQPLPLVWLGETTVSAGPAVEGQPQAG